MSRDDMFANSLTLTDFSQPNNENECVGVVNTSRIVEALHFLLPQVLAARVPHDNASTINLAYMLPFKMINNMSTKCNPYIWIVHRNNSAYHTDPPTCAHRPYANIVAYHGFNGHTMGAVYGNDNGPEDSCFIARLKKVKLKNLTTDQISIFFVEIYAQI